MSEYSNEYRRKLFETLEKHTHPEMVYLIDTLHYHRRILELPEIDIPNIIESYYNTIVKLDEEFARAGIDFFEPDDCETRFAIDNYFLLLIHNSMQTIKNHMDTLTNLANELTSFLYNSPIFNGYFDSFEDKLQVMNYQLQYQKLSFDAIKQYSTFNKIIADFSIEKNIVSAILTYIVLLQSSDNSIFPNRMAKIDLELQKLGYQSVFPILQQQLETRRISLEDIPYTETIIIKRK